MLYQELPRIDSTPLDGWGDWLIPALIGAASITAGVLMLLIWEPWLAGAAFFTGFIGAAISLRRSRAAEAPIMPVVGGPDYSLVGSALGLSSDPIVLTNGEGALLVMNEIGRAHV